jgi:hypothetical protein
MQRQVRVRSNGSTMSRDADPETSCDDHPSRGTERTGCTMQGLWQASILNRQLCPPESSRFDRAGGISAGPRASCEGACATNDAHWSDTLQNADSAGRRLLHQADVDQLNPPIDRRLRVGRVQRHLSTYPHREKASGSTAPQFWARVVTASAKLIVSARACSPVPRSRARLTTASERCRTEVFWALIANVLMIASRC